MATTTTPTQAALVSPQQITMTTPSVSAYQYLVAWGVIFLILALINRSRIGHAAIYYTLVLAIVLLIVTQADAITSLLTPIIPHNNGSEPVNNPPEGATQTQ